MESHGMKIFEIIDRLRNLAENNPAMSNYANKVLTSVHAELETAQENAVILQILDVLNRVNSSAATSIQYDKRRELLSEIARAVLDSVNADVVVLYETPETGQRLKARPGLAGDLYSPGLMLNEVPQSSKINSFLKSNEAVFIEYANQVPLLTEREAAGAEALVERFTIREKVKSTAICPLMFSGSMVGLMFVNYRTSSTFSSERRQSITEMSGHIALAMHNMRWNRRVVESNQRLETLFKIVDSITNKATNKQDVLDTAIKGMVELIDAPHGAIVHWDTESDSGRVVAEYSIDSIASVGKRSIPKDLPLSKIILNGEIRSIENVDTDSVLSKYDREILQMAGIKSVLIVPVIDDQQRVVASIGIDETRSYRRFPDADINLCRILAGQVATAYKLAESITQDKRNVVLLELQQRAMKVLSETDDPDKAFEFIVHEGLKLIGGVNGQLLRVNFDKDFVETDYSTLEEEIGLRYPLRFSITGQAAMTRQPVNVPDLESSELKSLYKAGYDTGIKSELAVPLIDEHKTVIGVLNAESTSFNAFSTEHETIWQDLAYGMVTVIQLAEVIAEKAALSSLASTRQMVAQGSIPDLGPILREILERAMDFADARKDGFGQLLLIDDDQLNLTIEQSTLPEDIGHKVLRDDSISGLAVDRKTTVYVGNLQEDIDPERGPYRNLHQWFSPIQMKCELAVPLLFNGTAVGVINLEKATPNAFTELHARLVGALATEATMIIMQARFREKELQQRLEEQQNRDIANILHRLNNPLGAIRQFASLAEETLDQPNPAIESIRNDLHKISDSADKVALLVRDLRDQLRRVEALRVNVVEVLANSLEVWQSRHSELTDTEIEIRQSVPDDLPKVRCGDKLSYVIWDLLDNALEAIETGGKCNIEVTVDSNEKFVEIRISDNGCGIRKSHWDVVFEDSYHTPKARLSDESGGIGLWWGRRYLQGYGGDLYVASSELNVGTTMAIRLQAW
jgi:GAF domain-containing protein